MMRNSKRKSAMPSCGAMVINKRKKAVIFGSTVSLPDEMILEVLLRLPVKSIVRFQAVCRSWAVLFSSEEFCSLHAKVAKTRPAPPKLLLVSPTERFDSTEVYSSSPSDPKADLLFTLDYASGNFVEVLTPAPCCGLTLLYDAVAPAYYICNAATRSVTRLPPFHEDPTHRSTTGLGFDARTRKYKVVRLINGLLHEKEWIRCEVYTAGGGYGDRWRPATGGVPFGLRRFANAAVNNAALSKLPPVFANGFLHWLVKPSSFIKRPRAAVISFSVTQEIFSCVLPPPFWTSEIYPPSPFWAAVGAPSLFCPGALGEHLVEMDNQLCMVRDLRKTGTLEIWKLLDYRSGDWSLNHRINLLGNVARDLREPQIVRVIGSIGNCQSEKKIIIATSKHKVGDKFQKKVHSYDPRSEDLETILSITATHTSIRSEITSSRFSLFEETLAPVYKTDEEIALSSTLVKATKEILLRLPAKSAIQSKLVCKQWLRLIENETFIQSYFKHKNMDKRPKVMLVGKGTGKLGFSFTPLNRWLREDPCHSTLLDTKVVCSRPCHGLNLISTETKDYLCNPCTGFHRVYCKLVANSHLARRTPIVEQHAFAVGNRIAGLGFNPLTREHFVVEILYHLKDFKSRRYNLTCLLRLCNSGIYARQNLIPPLPVNDMPPAYLEGVLYWMSEPRLGERYERAIVSFNIATNMFGVIHCPSCIAMWNSQSFCRAFVVELERVLCAILEDPVVNSLDVWKLQHGQWGRAYTIRLKAWPGYSLRRNVVVPLGVDPDDGRILLHTGRKIGLYDPVERTIQNLYSLDQGFEGRKIKVELNTMDSTIMPFVPMLYEESLVCCPRVAETRRLR